MDPVTAAVVVKTFMYLWLVSYTPTPQCLARDAAANTVKILVGKKTNGAPIYELARKPGARAIPKETTEWVQIWDSKKKPTFVKTPCYDVRAGLVKRVRMVKLYDIAAELKKKLSKAEAADLKKGKKAVKKIRKLTKKGAKRARRRKK